METNDSTDNKSNLSSDEKRILLKDFNHRINNDLQALLAFIKLQKRFGIDYEEIINSSCVSIASISTIQNMMYKSDDDNNYISTIEFFGEFIKTLNDYYTPYNITFSNLIEKDFIINPKKMFHIMFLINEMINLSINFSLDDDSDNNISFNLEKIDEKCLLTYSDNSSGIQDILNESNMRTVIFEQLVKQIDGNLECNDSIISIKFNYN